MGRFDRKVVFITGVARGQGRSHAIEFAREGATVVGIDVCANIDSVPEPLATQEDLEETARLVAEVGGTSQLSVGDVRSLDDVRSAIDSAVREYGRLDVLCANAGILSTGATADLSTSSWQDMIDVNLTGVWHAIKAATPSLIATGSGSSIVITSSAAGLKGYPNVAHYSAAKHGTIGLMRSVAHELAPHMVRVNCVCPTQVRTPMIMNENTWKRFCPDIESPSVEDFDRVSATMNVLPVPAVEAIDVSRAVLFLASAEARFITGVALPVDAGASLL